MQGLRTRLTLAETKLVEKEVELNALKEENSGLKESIDKISQQQQAAFNKSDSESNLFSLPSLFFGQKQD
jgi:predicted  nucleic acid-binding Zn-ribbon protein